MTLLDRFRYLHQQARVRDDFHKIFMISTRFSGPFFEPAWNDITADGLTTCIELHFFFHSIGGNAMVGFGVDT